MSALSAGIARALEGHALRGPLWRATSRLWERFAEPARPLTLPRSAAWVGVGGATLGGSGKTPVTAELAVALTRLGKTAAVIASGYPATVKEPVLVSPTHDVRDVGDEALWLARRLATDSIPVVVARRRELAVARAAELAEVVIVDGLLQTSPERMHASLLCFDGRVPFRMKGCPPSGDLRASADRLAQATDIALVLGEPEQSLKAWTTQVGLPLQQGTRRVEGVRIGGRMQPIAELASLRVGVCLAVAHPARVLATLADLGVTPDIVILERDHHTPRLPNAPVDLWLCTEKCALKLPPVVQGVPVGRLVERTQLPNSLISLVFVRCFQDPSSLDGQGGKAIATRALRH